jgi:superfamily II DNA or RNA helicase
MNLTPYDYQYKAAWLILNYRQSLSQLATRAGKTLIAYMVFRYALEHGAHNILMIVPSRPLVRQAVADMQKFKEFFTTETVWSGGELCEGSNLTIGTFQSLVKRFDKKSTKYDPDFFNKFDIVCCDEAHTAKCESIKTILQQNFMKNVKVRFGFSGSLPKDETIESFACGSLLGPMIQDVRSYELIDRGFISDVRISQYYIEYKENIELYDNYIRCAEYLCSEYVNDENKEHILLPKDEREFTIQHVKKMPVALKHIKNEIIKESKAMGLNDDERELYWRQKYVDYLYSICKQTGSNALLLEQMLVHRSQARIRLIDRLLSSFKKNSIVFAHHTEYLKMLHDYFKALYPNRNVYMIHGGTTTKKREQIIANLEKDTDAILFASYACIGTGLTLRNLDYGIFAQSFRSEIINKQSLGRGLMLAEDKEYYQLYDIIDVFPTKRIYRQGLDKKRLYAEEKFTFNIHKVVDTF